MCSILEASLWQTSRRSASFFVVSNGFRRLTCARCGVFWRLREDWRRGSRRWLSWVVSSGIQGLTCGMCCNLEASWWQPPRRLASVFQRRVQWYPKVHLCQIWRLMAASRHSVSVFAISCPLVSLGSSAPRIASCGGFAKLGADFKLLVQWHSLDHLR
jgi:hypothetical protein